VLTHDLSRKEAEKLENELADLLDLRILERSSAESERVVREAFDEEPPQSEPGGEREPRRVPRKE
jgi:hypothetical protein